jgi:glutaredoxin
MTRKKSVRRSRSRSRKRVSKAKSRSRRVSRKRVSKAKSRSRRVSRKRVSKAKSRSRRVSRKRVSKAKSRSRRVSRKRARVGFGFSESVDRMSGKWIVYTKDGCPYCTEAIEFLKNKGQSVDARRGEECQKEIVEKLSKTDRPNYSSWPRVFNPQGQFVGGNGDLQKNYK